MSYSRPPPTTLKTTWTNICFMLGGGQFPTHRCSSIINDVTYVLIPCMHIFINGLFDYLFYITNVPQFWWKSSYDIIRQDFDNFFSVSICRYGWSSVGDPRHFGADPGSDWCLRIALNLDSTPDPTPFFNDFEDAKKYFFHILFFQLTTGTLSSDLKI